MRLQILLLCLTAGFLSPQFMMAAKQDSIPETGHRSWGRRLLTPFEWVITNWSAYDPAYSTPSFYDWAGQMQNTFSKEMISMDCEGMSNLYLTSRTANRIGPYFGYNFLFWGLTIDLNNLEGSRRRHEFTIAVNSQLMNIDLIYRRTGGDFYFRELSYKPLSSGREVERRDISDWANENDLGRTTCYDITGVNASYFLNHKRYSNPAAFSNGAIQLRSCGSPIVGLGYTHHRLKMEVSDMLVRYSCNLLGLPMTETRQLTDLYDIDRASFFRLVKEQVWRNPACLQESDGELMASLFNRIPSRVSIDDWHLQLGYGYNVVCSKRMLFGVSALLAPSIKHITSTNEGTFPYLFADDMVRLLSSQSSQNEYEPGMFRTTKHGTSFSTDAFLRMSYVWNYNHWRAGLSGNLNVYGFVFDRSLLVNTYGSAAAYVGYTFGRKRQYRYGGRNRDAYIDVALSSGEAEEMRDSLPVGNLPQDDDVPLSGQSQTNYELDLFDIRIEGGELAMGPDGSYGGFVIEEGFVPDGMDSEQKVAVGASLALNQYGQLAVKVGHRPSIRACNWWKSEVDVKSLKMRHVPDKLHYALRGTLTCYVKGNVIGRDKTMPLVIEDVYLCHGDELMTPFSIERKGVVGDRPCTMEMKTLWRGKSLRFKFKKVKHR